PFPRLDEQAGVVEQREMAEGDRDVVEGNQRRHSAIIIARHCGCWRRVQAESERTGLRTHYEVNMRFRVALALLVGTTIATGAVLAQAPKTSWDGVYSDEQSKRGAALYGQHCASCHGDDLSGTGSEAPA